MKCHVFNFISDYPLFYRTLTLNLQQLQVDLTVDIGQKISNRLATPGGHLDKDMSHYDEAQKMVLKELVPFYAG